MFEGLKRKWGVSGLRFVLIICVFAIGGSLTGFLAKKIMPYFNIESSVKYLILYILIVTVMWPFCILAVSLLFGQFSFFWEYLKKMGRRISRNRKSG